MLTYGLIIVAACVLVSSLLLSKRLRSGHDVFCFKHSPHDQPGKKQST